MTASDQPLSSARTGASPVVFAALTAAGGILVLFGSFLPWLTVSVPILGQVSMNGMKGDGILTVIVGIAGIVVGAIRLLMPTPRFVQRAGIVLGVAAVLIVAVDTWWMYSNIDQSAAGQFASSFISLGVGIAVVALGGISLVLGGLVLSPVREFPNTPAIVTRLRSPHVLVGGAGAIVVVGAAIAVTEVFSTGESPADAYARTGYSPPAYSSMENQRQGVCANLNAGMSEDAAAAAFAQGWTVPAQTAEAIVAAIKDQGC